MDLYSLTEQTWIDRILITIDSIVESEEIPEKSLQLVSNYGKDKEKITSYSIAVLKPDYPKGTNPNGLAKNVLINIKPSGKGKNPLDALMVSVSDNLLSQINKNFPDIELVKKKSDPITRAKIDLDCEYFDSFFYFIIKASLYNYFREGSDSFGCCHLYEKCSDARKCLHENKLYARGCTYGSHLAEGRIFYGKNRNV